MAKWTVSADEYVRILEMIRDAPVEEQVFVFLADGTVMRGLLEGSGLELDQSQEPNPTRIHAYFRLTGADGVRQTIEAMDIQRIRPRPKGSGDP